MLNQSIIISALLLADLSTANIALGFMLSKKRFCRRSDDEDLLAAQAKFIPPITAFISLLTAVNRLIVYLSEVVGPCLIASLPVSQAIVLTRHE